MNQLTGRWPLLALLALSACSTPAPSEGPEGLGTATDELGRPTLPNWATPEEAAREAESSAIAARRVSTPPAAGFRVPAEYEPVKAVVMTWTSYTTMLRGAAQAAAAAGAEVWMVNGPASIQGVPAAQYKPLSLGFNSVWMRDYGPTGFDQSTGALGVIDSTYRHHAVRTSDDALPCSIAQSQGAGCFSTDLILDGGNFMIDDVGNVFFTRRLYDWNSGKTQAQVDQLLRDYYGAKALHVFDYAKSGSNPADGTGHLDMFVKLLSTCKVMVAQATAAPFKATTDAAAAYFANLNCPTGGKYTVYRTPGWVQGGAWYTYTNSLIVNKTVIVPSYQGADNEAARAVYQSALAGYTIAMVNSDSSIVAGGSIHCVTQQIPAPPATSGNRAPASNAGADQELASGTAGTLDGSASADPDGDPLTYQWTQTLGPSVALSAANAAKPTFTAPTVSADTQLTFELVVSDGKVSSAADSVSIVVKAPGSTLEQAAVDVPLAIPDNNATGIVSSLNFAGAATVTAADVEVNITHPYVGDLQVVLTCPGGNSVTLYNRTGGSADNLVQTFSVSACNGQSAQGVWKLKVSDGARQDVGTLNAWKLRVR